MHLSKLLMFCKGAKHGLKTCRRGHPSIFQYKKLRTEKFDLYKYSSPHTTSGLPAFTSLLISILCVSKLHQLFYVIPTDHEKQNPCDPQSFLPQTMKHLNFTPFGGLYASNSQEEIINSKKGFPPLRRTKLASEPSQVSSFMMRSGKQKTLGCPIGFVRINGLFHLLINGLYIGVTTH